MLKRVQSVYYTVKDMNRAQAFYDKVFSMKLKFRDGDKWAQFDAGNVSVALSSKDESASAEGGAVVAFEVENMEAFEARLKDAGAEILQRRDMGDHGKVIAFRDSEGNIVQIFAKA